LNGDFKYYGYTQFHYRPFTLESSFGYCDALQEMLLQEHQGYLHLFPAIPDDWTDRTVSFTDLRSYGGVLVSANAVKGKTASVTLTLPKAREIKLKNTFGADEITLKVGKKKTVLRAEDGYFTFTAKRGTVQLYK
jgi:alpha-L-fucosidase 2